jgi:hypothetical protein
MDLTQLAGIINNLMSVAPDLERLGSLASVETEAKARIARLQTDEATIYKSLLARARSEAGELWAVEARTKAQADADGANAQRQNSEMQVKLKDLETRAAQLAVANDATEARLKRAHDAFRATG